MVLRGLGEGSSEFLLLKRETELLLWSVSKFLMETRAGLLWVHLLFSGESFLLDFAGELQRLEWRLFIMKDGLFSGSRASSSRLDFLGLSKFCSGLALSFDE